MHHDRPLPHWTDEILGIDRETVQFSGHGRFTPAQKHWLDQAWREFCHGQIPDVFAVHQQKCGISVVSWTIQGPFEWHHIIPGVDCLLHGEDPDVPQNAIPLPKRIHTGPEIEAIHPDISDAKWLWSACRQGKIPNPFADITSSHHRLALYGIKYWDSSYDQFFLQLAGQVTSSYSQKHPETTWPIRKPQPLSFQKP